MFSTRNPLVVQLLFPYSWKCLSSVTSASLYARSCSLPLSRSLPLFHLFPVSQEPVSSLCAEFYSQSACFNPAFLGSLFLVFLSTFSLNSNNSVQHATHPPCFAVLLFFLIRPNPHHRRSILIKSSVIMHTIYVILISLAENWCEYLASFSLSYYSCIN